MKYVAFYGGKKNSFAQCLKKFSEYICGLNI